MHFLRNLTIPGWSKLAQPAAGTKQLPPPVNGVLTVPDGWTSLSDDDLLDSIPSDILTNVVEVVLPTSLRYLSDMTLSEMYSLERITVPEAITYVPASCFTNCISLKSIVLPEGVSEIGNFAFHDCFDLTRIVLPDSLRCIGDNAFSSCISLQQINLPDSLVTIPASAFAECTSLQHVKFPANLKKIGPAAFSGCSQLHRINIPDTVTTIGRAAFAQCEQLESVTIPASVRTIAPGAFATYGTTIFFVNSSNDNFIVRNNCILTRDGTTIVHAAPDVDGVCRIPDGVVKTAGDQLDVGCATELRLPARFRGLATTTLFGRNLRMIRANCSANNFADNLVRLITNEAVPKDLALIADWDPYNCPAALELPLMRGYCIRLGDGDRLSPVQASFLREHGTSPYVQRLLWTSDDARLGMIRGGLISGVTFQSFLEDALSSGDATLIAAMLDYRGRNLGCTASDAMVDQLDSLTLD